MTADAIGQSLLLKMPPILRDCQMAAEAVVKLEQWLAVRLMAGAAFILHRRLGRKRFPLKGHARMAGRASFLFGLEPIFVLGEKLVAGGAVKRLHPADIRARLGVTSGTFFGRRFDRVKRR